MKYIQIILWGLIFFVAFFLKRIDVGGQELVYAWKLPLLCIMLAGVVGRKSGYVFISLGYIFAIKNLISSHVLIYPFDAIINFIKYLIIPVFIHWIVVNVRSIYSLRVLRILPFYLSVFFIISNIPFYFGLFSKTTKILLVTEGGGIEGFLGLLGTAHQSSAVLAITSLILINFLINGKNRGYLKYIITPIIMFGVFFLYKTYARTGWLMFVIGFIALFVHKITFRDIWKFAVAGFILLIGFVVLLQTSDTFRRRIFDDRQGDKNLPLSERIGSGRLAIAGVYLANYMNSDFTTLMIGMGMQESIRRHGEKTGMPIFAHNGFIEALVDNGIIGFILYMFFVVKMYVAIGKSQSSNVRMAKALFFMFVSCLLTQQANYYLVDVFLALYVGLVLVESEVNKYVYRQRILRNQELTMVE